MITKSELRREMTIVIHLHATRFSFLATDVKRFWTCLGLAKVEQKLINAQLEYLRQCQYICSIFILLNIQLSFDYTMNNFLEDTQAREIAKQWNIDDFDFYIDLEVSKFLLIPCRYSHSHF